MNYEKIYLEEKLIAGLCVRTSNGDPLMPQIIGGLWQKLFTQGIYPSIPHKANDCTIALYSNYETDFTGAYDVTVGCEITHEQGLPDELEVKKIPAMNYAKFVVTGNPQSAMSEFWTKLWAMNLNRAYTGDFEEYQEDSNDDCCHIHVYIALKA